MTTGQYISVRETAQLLGINEKKVMDLIETKDLHAYKIANQFLRLKKSEVLNLRNSGSVKDEANIIPYTSLERIKDFLYFNDFYILSTLLIIVLVYIILYG